LTPLTAVIGKNGVGKSSLFDAFGFLADCLKLGVEEACDARGRGGYHRIRSLGINRSIEFEIYYREKARARPITYELAIGKDHSGRPYVTRERLRQRRTGQSRGWPFSFLMMNEGRGVAWKGDSPGEREDKASQSDAEESYIERIIREAREEESAEKEVIELQDKRKLGIATLGGFETTPQDIRFPTVYRRMVSKLFHAGCCPQSAVGRLSKTLEYSWRQPGQRCSIYGTRTRP